MLAGVLVLGAGATALWLAPKLARRPNVVLVTLDTFRPDHLGVEGYPFARTPNLDRFANQGFRFRHCWSSVPITLPSHSTILTGRSPVVHGARDNGIYTLGPENETLAERLGLAGYRTAAFVSSFPLRRRFGVDQGFQVYDDNLGAEGVLWGETPPAAGDELLDQRPGDATMSAALAWLRAREKAAPFFLWVHLFDAHQPYDPPSPYKETFSGHPYDGEIAFIDEQFGRLVAELDALGLRDHTVVIVTGDHGEGLGDHGEITHAMLTYDSTMRVPLLMQVPGASATGGIVDQPVGLVDLFATTLDLAGLTIPRESEGRSLVPLLRAGDTGDIGDPWRSPPLYFESEAGANGFGWARLVGIRSGRFKYIRGVREELYDVASDPGERTNLVAARAAELAEMRRLLAGYLQRTALAAQPLSSRLQQTAESRARLAALGYVAANAAPTPEPGALGQGLDPAAHIELINDWSAAREALSRGDFERAQDRLSHLLQYEPDNPSVLIIQGVLYARTGRDALAAALLERALPRAVKDFGAQAVLADVYRRLGQPGKSLQVLERCADLDPLQRPAYLISIAVLKRSLGDLDGALAAVQEAARLAPERSEPRWLEGTLRVRRGELDKAEIAFGQAIAISPAEARYRQNLAALYLDQGRTAAAVEEARRAVQLSPEYPEGRYILGLALLRDGETAEGRKALEDLARSLPDSKVARAALDLLANSPSTQASPVR